MRTSAVLFGLTIVCVAQTPPPALLRGVLLERDTPGSTGQFSVRAADNLVFRFRFDPQTSVQRNTATIDVPRLQPGDTVEVQSEAVAGSPIRYARSVSVVESTAPAAPLRPLTSASRSRVGRTGLERPLPTGTLTFSGVVSRVNGDRLVLHLRQGRDQSILLRKDTRFVENGEVVEAATLKLNMRVFVRAGKDLYDQIEAYQVVWGKILEP